MTSIKETETFLNNRNGEQRKQPTMLEVDLTKIY